MNIKTTITIVFFAFPYLSLGQVKNDVFRIIAVRRNGTTITQTGFIYKTNAGTIGILTALHGVINSRTIQAENDNNEVYNSLEMSLVDTDLDLAFLTSKNINPNRRSIPIGSPFSSIGSNVRTLGYPLGIINIVERRTSGGGVLSVEGLGSLNNRVGSTTRDLITYRTSPSLSTEILFLFGSIRKGESGSPILNSQNQVIGMIDGGKEGINWAIPLTNIKLRSVLSQQSRINTILRNDSNADLYSETLNLGRYQLLEDDNGEKIEVFLDADYSSYGFEIRDDWSVSNENDPWYKAISSIRIPDGWVVEVFTGFNFTGTSMILRKNWNAVYWADPWNDKINSIRIRSRK